MKSIKRKVSIGAGLLTIARAFINLLGFVSTLVLAKLLTPADFGIVALATSVLALVQSLTDISLSQALIQHTKPTEDHYHTAWTLNIARGAIIGLAFCLVAPIVATLYDDTRLTGVMIALGASVFMSGFSNVRLAALSRDLIFHQGLIISVTTKLMNVVVAISLATLTHSYWSLVIGGLAQQSSQILLSYMLLPYLPRFRVVHARELWTFSVWLTLAQAVSTLNYRFDQLLIGLYFSKSTLGHYTVGDNLAMLVTKEATMPLSQALLPAFAQFREDPARLRRAYTTSQTIVTSIALPASFGCALIADPLVRLSMGEKWMPAAYVITVLAASFGLQTLGSAVAPLAAALGKTKVMFRRELQFFFFQVPTIIVGIYAGGLLGVLIARWVTGIVYLVLSLYLVQRFINLSIKAQLISNARGIIGVLMMSTAVLLVRIGAGVEGSALHLIVTLALMTGSGVASYVLARWFLWAIMGYPDGDETQICLLLVRIVGPLLQHVRNNARRLNK